jgi:molybdopterin-guanine dinucleotide biosynthesis protein A
VTPPRRTGAIIAGGRGTRLGGRDKSHLAVGGRLIIDRQVDLLQQVTDEVILVGSHPSRPATLGVPVHADRVTGCGAIGGLYTALEVARGDRVVVIACDMPFLVAPLLARLVAMTDRADAAWVRTSAGVEPLVACYQRGTRTRVREAIEAGRLKLADLARILTIAELGGAELAAFGDPARLVTNVNTLDEYERIQ